MTISLKVFKMRKRVTFFAAFFFALIAAGIAVKVCHAAQATDKVVIDENGVRRLGPAWMKKLDGIYVLYLEGSSYETAREHGLLLRDEINQGELVYLRGYLHNEIRHSVVGGNALLSKFAEETMMAMYYDPIARRHPEEVKQAMRGLSQGSGLPYKTIARVMTHSDSGQTIEGKVYKNRKYYPALDSFAGSGCTTFIALGKAAKDGHVIHGRNFDYPGGGWFDRFPLVAFVRPASGQRYVMLTSAGMHTGGITGLNESGLTVAWNTAITTDVEPTGIPIFSLADKILREAASMDQALSIIKNNRPSCGYIITISSAKEQKGIAIELTRRKMFLVPLENNTLAIANSFRTPELRKNEIAATWSEVINSQSRARRMTQLLRDNFGRIDPQKGAEFLGDHFDINIGRERATGDVISQSSNVSSVVIDSTAMKFWIASGRAPVANSSYAGFNFEDGFKGPEKLAELPALRGVWEKDPRIDGLRLFNSAQNNFERDDLEGSLKDIQSAMLLDPAEPVYAQTAGLLLLKTGKPGAAAPMFEKALSLPQTFHKQSLGHLWLGRSFDLQGKREQAKKEYQKVLLISPLNPSVKKAAETGIKKPFTPKQAKKIPIVFDCGDSYNY